MKIITVLTVLAAIVLVQASSLSTSIPRGESITSSSNSQAMEKRAPFVRSNNGISGEHHIKRSDDNHDLRKRTFMSRNTPRSSSFNPSGGVGGEGSGDLRKRRSLSPNSVTRTVKRAGGYNPGDPQGGSGDDLKKRRDISSSASNIMKAVKRSGGYSPRNLLGGEGGDDIKKRSSSTKSETFRKREGEMDPVDPFANEALGGADFE